MRQFTWFVNAVVGGMAVTRYIMRPEDYPEIERGVWKDTDGGFRCYIRDLVYYKEKIHNL